MYRTLSVQKSQSPTATKCIYISVLERLMGFLSWAVQAHCNYGPWFAAEWVFPGMMIVEKRTLWKNSRSSVLPLHRNQFLKINKLKPILKIDRKFCTNKTLAFSPSNPAANLPRQLCRLDLRKVGNLSPWVTKPTALCWPDFYESCLLRTYGL